MYCINRLNVWTVRVRFTIVTENSPTAVSLCLTSTRMLLNRREMQIIYGQNTRKWKRFCFLFLSIRSHSTFLFTFSSHSLRTTTWAVNARKLSRKCRKKIRRKLSKRSPSSKILTTLIYDENPIFVDCIFQCDPSSIPFLLLFLRVKMTEMSYKHFVIIFVESLLSNMHGVSHRWSFTVCIFWVHTDARVRCILLLYFYIEIGRKMYL